MYGISQSLVTQSLTISSMCCYEEPNIFFEVWSFSFISFQIILAYRYSHKTQNF